jgi:hypothetical protein
MFNKTQITTTVLFTIISLLFAGVSLVSASGEWAFSYVQAPSSFNCSPNRVLSNDGAISYTLPSNAQITNREYINGNLYAAMSSSISGSGRYNFPVFSSIFPTQQSYPYVYTVSYTVNVDGATISESTLSVRCNGKYSAVVLVNSLDFAEGVETAATAPDSRMNWGFGDSNVAVIYPSADSLGLYLYASDLYIPNFLTTADISAYVDNSPSVNTLVASIGTVSVYILTTGEIQFNMTDQEGKQYVLIMSDLNGSGAYGYSIDAQA